MKSYYLLVMFSPSGISESCKTNMYSIYDDLSILKSDIDEINSMNDEDEKLVEDVDYQIVESLTMNEMCD